MSDDEFDTGRKTPPEDHEWPNVWKTLERSKRSWPITAPFVAVIENWRALCAVAGIVTVIRGPEIIDVIRNFLETMK